MKSPKLLGGWELPLPPWRNHQFLAQRARQHAAFSSVWPMEGPAELSRSSAELLPPRRPLTKSPSQPRVSPACHISTSTCCPHRLGAEGGDQSRVPSPPSRGVGECPPAAALPYLTSQASCGRRWLVLLLRTMKMHFSIPLSEELLEKFGGRYVLYSLYLEGFIFCKVRYSQLHRWNEQLRRVFGRVVPSFPPKFYLAMTKAMADERRAQLEQYLQNVSIDPAITNSDVFISFFRKLQQDTFKIPTQQAFLDVYLPDGRYLRIDIQTSDTAERVLEVVSYKIGLSRELIGYFSLFLIQDHSDGKLSVLKKMPAFELPYVSLRNMKESSCKIGLRKWYMDPSLDKMLMDCRTSVNLLYMQVVQEMEKNWIKPTEGQMQKLQMLQNAPNKMKFLELVREVQHYGYTQLDPCPCDYPEVGCTAAIHVGNNEISCCIKLPSNQIKEVSFKINRVRCWQVTFLGSVLGQGLDQFLELRLEYNDSDTWRWIVFKTKQAFLLSSCLKKIISEQLITITKGDREMIELPEPGKTKKPSIHPSQIFHSSLQPRKRISSKPNVEDCVFEKIREEDL
ncbi:sorting nexin-31 isoform X3 [Hemicordylus capensis]|uniref:sorting nexin-31 isoform X3 n=1 Tax=Hemicordylus capensis TaxID=884348 RepID=UPI002302F59C|nr:sorting nexin-31 isoform X3 [Hemicordylus capensis]